MSWERSLLEIVICCGLLSICYDMKPRRVYEVFVTKGTLARFGDAVSLSVNEAASFTLRRCCYQLPIVFAERPLDVSKMIADIIFGDTHEL